MEEINQKGFGMSTMIAIIAILILFIIIFSIIAYNNGLEKDSPNSIYESTEEND